MEIIPLEDRHLPDAARLFAAAFREQRERLPILPARHEDEAGVLPMLSGLLSAYPGVAASEGGRLQGYLIGLPLPAFKGSQRGAYVPIWGHAAAGDDRAAIYRRLYARLAREWVAAGCLTHAVTLYPGDREAAGTWFRNGFGLLVVDAVRPLDPIGAPDLPEVEIRQATPEDAGLVQPLALELDRYLAGAPIFLAFLESAGTSVHAAWLAEPGHALWLALHQGRPVAYLRCQPPGEDVAYIVSDPGTVSITGAYAVPDWRGRGIAAALLDRLLAWARANGYRRCAVDFESQNDLGSRFWLRHFQPICHTLIRHLDDRIAWARPDRPAASLW
jgi:GNAT superfamily N-acetyltransferase